MPEPTDETLATWLSAVTVTTDPPVVKPFQTAITHVLSEPTGQQLLDLVAIAHGRGDSDARAALTAMIKVKNDDFVVGTNAALLECVAAAAIVRSLSGTDKNSTMIGLAVQTAAWLGLTPAIPEVTTLADATIAAAAISSRSREPWEPIADEITELLPGEPAVTNAEGVVETEEVDGYEAAIYRLAKAIDDLGARLGERLALVDEEYDSLWWSYTGTSDVDHEVWDDVDPVGLRTVRVATELGGKISRVPVPPVVPGLIALALGDKRDKNVSLQELTKHVVATSSAPAKVAAHLLLPVSSSAEVWGTFEGDEALWTKAAKTRIGIDAKRSTTALESALQLIREKQICDLL